MTAENAVAAWVGSVRSACFNEAAADDRGKQVDPVALRRLVVASMRPRPMTAENVTVQRQRG